MKNYFYILFTLVFFACSQEPSDRNEPLVLDSMVRLEPDSVTLDNASGHDTTDSMEEDDEHETFFIVIADTSLKYYELHKEMMTLQNTLGFTVDTMGRLYNPGKDLIALPDHDEDEIYAGDYFPRRFPSNTLSLEYLDFYTQDAGKKTIALVTGIYETERSADSALTVLKQAKDKAFKVKAEVYVGCMH